MRRVECWGEGGGLTVGGRVHVRLHTPSLDEPIREQHGAEWSLNERGPYGMDGPMGERVWVRHRPLFSMNQSENSTDEQG